MLPLTPNPIFSRRPDAAQDELHDRTAFSRQAKRRQMLGALQAANAVRDLKALPGPEESLHLVCRGNFPLYQIIPATLSLARPAIIEDLHIATLGFSRANATDLLALLDAGQVRHVHIVASVYFERQCPAEWHVMADGLRARRQKIVAIRSHAKIIAMKLSDGRGITVESSANLRSCRNIEQLTITNSEPLRAFHARWIEEVTRNAK